MIERIFDQKNPVFSFKQVMNDSELDEVIVDVSTLEELEWQVTKVIVKAFTYFGPSNKNNIYVKNAGARHFPYAKTTHPKNIMGSPQFFWYEK